MTEVTLAKEFGTMVRRLRTERGFYQEEFAYRCGLHRTYMGDIERSEKNVTLVTADKIAKALGLTLAGLLLEMERNHHETGGG